MLATGTALVFGNRISAFAIPLASRAVLDHVVLRHESGTLTPVAVMTAVALALQCVSGYAAGQIVGIGAQRAVTTLRISLVRHVVELPVGFFDRSQAGTLAARLMGDTEQLRLVMGSGLMLLLSGVLTGVLALVFLFRLNVLLTLVILLVLALFTGGAARGMRWLGATFHTVSARSAELTGRLTETFGGIRVVKANTAERLERLAFARRAHALLRVTMQATSGLSLFTSSATLANGIVSLLVLVVGGRAVLHGTMTPGDVVMYAFLVSLLSAPLLQVTTLAGELGKAFAALGRIGELRQLETESADDTLRGARSVSCVKGHVVFEHVSYVYEGAASPALRDIDFVALPGTTTALVGRSGSGKSTLCHLLLAYHRPTRGRVRVDGRDLTSLRRTDYRRCVGLVPQDGFLFDASVLDNIRYARPRATSAEVRAVARAAHCDEFIDALPRGYSTVIGERGIRLSGGQRQRLAIARALLIDPQILILDEATSHLDTENETLIQEALATLTLGRTTFVIAHRVSTVVRADQILVLADGEVAARGTHAELLASAPAYGRLHGRSHVANGSLAFEAAS
jgi:subfamily B ATP-binding cassette protein MsbA